MALVLSIASKEMNFSKFSQMFLKIRSKKNERIISIRELSYENEDLFS